MSKPLILEYYDRPANNNASTTTNLEIGKSLISTTTIDGATLATTTINGLTMVNLGNNLTNKGLELTFCTTCINSAPVSIDLSISFDEGVKVLIDNVNVAGVADTTRQGFTRFNLNFIPNKICVVKIKYYPRNLLTLFSFANLRALFDNTNLRINPIENGTFIWEMYNFNPALFTTPASFDTLPKIRPTNGRFRLDNVPSGDWDVINTVTSGNTKSNYQVNSEVLTGFGQESSTFNDVVIRLTFGLRNTTGMAQVLNLNAVVDDGLRVMVDGRQQELAGFFNGTIGFKDQANSLYGYNIYFAPNQQRLFTLVFYEMGSAISFVLKNFKESISGIINTMAFNSAELAGSEARTGSNFDFTCPPGTFINEINSRGGDWQDSVQVKCSDNTQSGVYGGSGGNAHLRQCATGFNRMTIHQNNNYINGLVPTCGTTLQARTSGSTSSVNTANVDCGNGVLTRVYGNSGTFLNSVGFECGPRSLPEATFTPVSISGIRYVALVSKTAALQLSQIAVLGTNGTNLALNKVPTGTTAAVNTALAKVTDGTLAIRAAPHVYQSNSNDARIIIDLGAASVIANIVIYGRSDCCKGSLVNSWIELLGANNNLLAYAKITNTEDIIFISPNNFTAITLAKGSCPDGYIQQTINNVNYCCPSDDARFNIQTEQHECGNTIRDGRLACSLTANNPLSRPLCNTVENNRNTMTGFITALNTSLTTIRNTRQTLVTLKAAIEPLVNHINTINSIKDSDNAKRVTTSLTALTPDIAACDTLITELTNGVNTITTHRGTGALTAAQTENTRVTGLVTTTNTNNLNKYNTFTADNIVNMTSTVLKQYYESEIQNSITAFNTNITAKNNGTVNKQIENTQITFKSITPISLIDDTNAFISKLKGVTDKYSEIKDSHVPLLTAVNNAITSINTSITAFENGVKSALTTNIKTQIDSIPTTLTLAANFNGSQVVTNLTTAITTMKSGLTSAEGLFDQITDNINIFKTKVVDLIQKPLLALITALFNAYTEAKEGNVKTKSLIVEKKDYLTSQITDVNRNDLVDEVEQLDAKNTEVNDAITKIDASLGILNNIKTKVLATTFDNFTEAIIDEIVTLLGTIPEIRNDVMGSTEIKGAFNELKDAFDFDAPVLSSYTQMINQIIASADSDIAGNRDYLIIKLEVDNIRKAIEDNITRIKGKVPAFTQKAFEDNIQAAKDAEKIGTSTEVTTAIDKANNSLASFKANITFVTDNITKLSVPDIYQYSGAKDIQTLRDYITKLREIQITNTEQVGNIEQKIDIITKAKKASDDAVIEAQGAAAAAKKKKLILFGGIGGGVLLLLIILFVLMRSKEE